MFFRRLKKLEAEEPVDPDEQRDRLLSVVWKEQHQIIEKEDSEKIIFYLTKGVSEDNFEPYPTVHIDRARKRIAPHLQLKPE